MPTSLARFPRSISTLILAWGFSWVSVLAQTDQTVTGNLNVIGNTDFGGNTFSFGSRIADPNQAGAIWSYTDGAAPQIAWSATQPSIAWLWQSAAGPQLKLDTGNALSLFASGTSTAAITLNPSGTSTFNQGLTVGGVLTASGGFKIQNTTVLATDGSNTLLVGSTLPAANVAIGTTTATARLTVAGADTSASSAAANFTDSTGKSLLLVRNDGKVGVDVITAGSLIDAPKIITSGRFYKSTYSHTGANPVLISALSEWSSDELPIINLGFEQGIVPGTEMDTKIFSYARTAQESRSSITIGRGRTDIDSPSVFINGNVGIGTSTPATNLHIANTDKGGMRIGLVNDWTNINVPIGEKTVQYNLDFSGFRDAIPDQIGARIAAMRFNNYNPGSALVQNTGLAFFTNPSGWGGTNDLTERLRITPSGNVGIGTTTPTARLEVAGDAKITGSLAVTKRATKLRVEPQGDLSMGTFTAGADIP